MELKNKSLISSGRQAWVLLCFGPQLNLITLGLVLHRTDYLVFICLSSFLKKTISILFGLFISGKKYYILFGFDETTFEQYMIVGPMQKEKVRISKIEDFIVI